MLLHGLAQCLPNSRRMSAVVIIKGSASVVLELTASTPAEASRRLRVVNNLLTILIATIIYQLYVIHTCHMGRIRTDCSRNDMWPLYRESRLLTRMIALNQLADRVLTLVLIVYGVR